MWNLRVGEIKLIVKPPQDVPEKAAQRRQLWRCRTGCHTGAIMIHQRAAAV